MTEITERMRTVARNKSREEAAELVEYHRDRGEDAWALAFEKRQYGNLGGGR